MADVKERIPPGQKLVKGWPVLHYGPIPSFDPNSWDFRVWGEVANPVTLSYPEFRALQVTRVKADFHCVTKFSVLDNDWEGVSFRVIHDMVQPKPSVAHVMAHCEYGYEANITLKVLLDEDVVLAWARNGELLTPEHGFPLRLVVPKRYAWKSAKWIRGVEFLSSDRRGFWEERGYHNNADPWGEERYSYQEDGSNGGGRRT
jgi:DMSO/TMAO reductase YedYZ molybdopterin-dependent catalytic subunit